MEFLQRTKSSNFELTKLNEMFISCCERLNDPIQELHNTDGCNGKTQTEKIEEIRHRRTCELFIVDALLSYVNKYTIHTNSRETDEDMEESTVSFDGKSTSSDRVVEFWDDDDSHSETSDIDDTEVPEFLRAPGNPWEASENHSAHIEGKKLPSQTSFSKQQTEQAVRNFEREFAVNTSDDAQKVLKQARALAQSGQKRKTTSPPPLITARSINGNGHARMGLLPQKSASNAQQQLSTDDLFLFGTAISQPTTNSVVSKPLQSRDLHPSSTQFNDNFDWKDHSRISQDHQWNPNDAKYQQRIGMAAGTMNTPGTTWSNPTTIPPNNMWQPPTLNNPFAVSNDPSEMNYTGTNNYPMNDNHDPFAVQPLTETQQQWNGSSGGL